MAYIDRYEAIEILDNRGYPTLKGRLYLKDKRFVELEIPSPLNSKKLKSLRDKDSRYLGYGMKKAAEIITNKITEKLKGVSVFRQAEIDQWLEEADNTEKKEILGVSTLLLVSLLTAKAGALAYNLPLFKYLNYLYQSYFKEKLTISSLPSIILTLITTQKNSSNLIDFKEFYLLPSSSYSFDKSLEIATSIYHKLKETFRYRNIQTFISESGGYMPHVFSNHDAFELILETILKFDLKLGVNIHLGVKVDAEDLFLRSEYKIGENFQTYTKNEFYKYISEIIKSYYLLYIENPFSISDDKNWKQLFSEFSNYLYIINTYIKESNEKILSEAIKEKKLNSMLIHLTDHPTLYSIFKTIFLARKLNLSYIFATELSETNQDFISDLAVAVQSPLLKFGPPVKGEQIAKYNRLLEIQKEL